MIGDAEGGSKPDLYLNDFKLEMILGEGGFGRVYLASLLDSTQKYAIKKINKKKLGMKANKNAKKGTAFELKIMLNIDHPFLAYMDYYFEDNKSMFFVMPFVDGAELDTIFQ